MNGILRGTTPDFVITVKKEDFAVKDVTKLEITVWNGSTVTQYGLEDVTTNTETNAFGIHFSEEFTLALEASKSFRWQMRCMFEDGNIVGTPISEPIDVSPLKSSEVMSG